jgi:hypothetical protein
MDIKDGEFQGGASGAGVTTLGQVMIEREKTKRLLIGASCVFLIIAALVLVFAPAEKQQLSYILGAALLLMAMGAIGATRFKITVPGISIDTQASAEPTTAKPQQPRPPVA